ncbi:unnamed protein product [Mytilus edulis]|uniref:DUF6570 domain-containing protein n=1 Tax=Mytilus edulis TaxID=6550 RepID=A0A8S3T4E7_MYTED|nr:unnamed protein product [Mytilus edulis]
MVNGRGWATSCKISMASKITQSNISIWIQGTDLANETVFTKEQYIHSPQSRTINILLSHNHFQLLRKIPQQSIISLSQSNENKYAISNKNVCSEGKINLKQTNGVCERCFKDKGVIKMFSTENSMNPGEAPLELANLSVVEEQLISRISPCINIHMLKHGGIAANGHCVAFPKRDDDSFNTITSHRLSGITVVEKELPLNELPAPVTEIVSHLKKKQEELIVQITKTDNDKKQVWNNKHACLFCNNLYFKIARHFEDNTKTNLNSHRKKCHHNQEIDAPATAVRPGKDLLPVPIYRVIILDMKDDAVKKCLMTDALIMKFGERLYERMGCRGTYAEYHQAKIKTS